MRRHGRLAGERGWLTELTDDLGDTDALVSGRNSFAEPEPGDVNEILNSVELALSASPRRADLWAARFQIYANYGMATEFARTMEIAWSDARLKNALPWAEVLGLWKQLAGASHVVAQLAAEELAQLDQAYQRLRAQPAFFVECARHTHRVLNRPTPLQPAVNTGGVDDRVRVFFKREDTRRSSPEMELAVAHAYLALRMGKSTLVAGGESEDFAAAIHLAAPEFHLQPVFCDTREEAVRYWQSERNSHLALGLAEGPEPYPQIQLDFQSLLGHETHMQLRARGAAQPRSMVSSLHSDADAIGFNHMYLDRPEVALHCAEPERAPAHSPSRRLRPYGVGLGKQPIPRPQQIHFAAISDKRAEAAREHMRLYEKIDVSLEDARAIALLQDLLQRETRARDYVVLID